VSQKQLSADFLALFSEGDVAGATAMLQRHPELTAHKDYTAHPLLRSFVANNEGHCYKDSHMRIANRLTPECVRSFRDAVLNGEVDEVQAKIHSDSELVHAEFTAGRGIAQAIHHWQSVSMAKVLVEAGADLEALTTRGESPLTMQLRFGTVPGVRFLLENGANVNNGVGGHMPSHQMDELIELLVAYGWDINNGQLLHDASHGHGTRVQTWLRHGADPNCRNSAGQTALHLIAARGNGREAIRALVEFGADINGRDEQGISALDLARKAKSDVAMQALIELGADTDT